MLLEDLKVLVDAKIDEGHGKLPVMDQDGHDLCELHSVDDESYISCSFWVDHDLHPPRPSCGHPKFPYYDSLHCATDTECSNYAGKFVPSYS